MNIFDFAEEHNDIRRLEQQGFRHSGKHFCKFCAMERRKSIIYWFVSPLKRKNGTFIPLPFTEVYSGVFTLHSTEEFCVSSNPSVRSNIKRKTKRVHRHIESEMSKSDKYKWNASEQKEVEDARRESREYQPTFFDSY